MKLNIPTSVLPLAVVAGIASASPAFAADKEQRQMMADIRMLQEQTQQIQNTLAALADALKAVDARLGARIDEQAEAARKAAADEKTIVSSISTDLRSVREKVDDNTTRVGSLTVEVQALRQLVTTLSAPRPAAPPPADAGADASSSSAPDSGPPAAAAAAPVSSAALGASPTKLFEEAYGDYALGQWDLAIQGFQDFIKSYPNHPQADEAQVMICNAYLTDGKYDRAVDACDQAIRTYPNGSATPDAYYRKGLALKSLKQTDRAREAFDYVVKNFADSQAATLAKQALEKP